MSLRGSRLSGPPAPLLRKEGLLVDFSNLSVVGAPPDQCSSRIPPWGELNSDLLNAIAFANPDTLCDFYPASKTTKALLTSRFREWNGTTGAKVENKYIKVQISTRGLLLSLVDKRISPHRECLSQIGDAFVNQMSPESGADDNTGEEAGRGIANCLTVHEDVPFFGTPGMLCLTMHRQDIH